MPRTSALLIATTLALAGLPSVSLAERAWIKDEVRLNIRTGPGVEYRIRGAVKTGDSFEVLSRTEGWTEVRGRDALQGWIPAGYLQAEAPARIRLERHEAEGVLVAARHHLRHVVQRRRRRRHPGVHGGLRPAPVLRRARADLRARRVPAGVPGAAPSDSRFDSGPPRGPRRAPRPRRAASPRPGP